MARNAIKLGVILAGGRGSRMGEKNKGEVLLGGKRLVDVVFERLSPQVDQIIINAQGALGLAIPHAPDGATKIKGPLAGLLASIKWGCMNLPKPFDVITVSVDTPFFPTDLVKRLSAKGGPAMATTKDVRQTTFGYWPDTIEKNLKGYIKTTPNPSIRGFAIAAKVPLVNFKNPEHFFNINTPEDLKAAEELVKNYF